jgi:hypothetical protein
VRAGVSLGSAVESQGPPRTSPNLAGWVRSSPLARGMHQRYGRWGNSEILGALQAWADANGRSPRATDWFHASIDHPCATTVHRQFKTWNRALKRAGLEPRGPEVRPWSDDEVLRALRRWTKRHGRPPKRDEWMRSGARRPCKTTVSLHFGNWRSALAAAGLNKHGRSAE